MPVKRLFDAIDHQLEKFPRADMLCSKEQGRWKQYATAEVKDIVNMFSAGLMQLGVSGNDMTPEGSDKIAIISNNRPEWVFTDMAVQQTGAVLVPLYPTTNPAELEFILNDSQAKFIFVSSPELFHKIQSIRHHIPSLKNIYSFDAVEGAEHWTSITALANEASLKEVERYKSEIPVSHLATIIYTSGTTGIPKGVMLSHSNIYTCLDYSRESFPFEDSPGKRALSFLPLNHIFEKIITYIYLYSGISIYYAESLDTIGDNLKEVKPHVFSTVPRLLEKVFERIMQKGNELGGVKRKLFFWSVALVERFDNNISGGWWYNMQLALANRLVLNKWRAALGGCVEVIVTGGAACQVRLIRIFSGAGIPVYEGYGPTENSPVISLNRKARGGTRYGTVGQPINHIEVKLEEDGEICVRGTTVMEGYYKRPDLTAETVIDGWLHTGDIGVMDEANFLKITDRKKELFKTSGGKYVAPQPIENKLKEDPLIEQVLVIGAERKFVGALIVPAFGNLRAWMQEKQIPFTTNEEAVVRPEVLALYRDIVEKYNPAFNHVEQIKKFELLPREWSIDTGEMTPKMSIKRKIVMEKYKAAVDRIYA